MSIIKLINIDKTYNPDTIPVHALSDLNLEFKQGEFTAIVGPSGCGKTTLLNIIGGLDQPTSGKVIIDGTDLSTLDRGQLIDFRLQNIGFVFQDYSLLPVLTARENTEFIMQLQKQPKKKIKERVVTLLREVGLEDKLNVYPTKLSGGQQQRVAVARALASKPKFVLADEPTANLDSHSTSDLLDIMLKLNREENITFIFSTHDQRVIDKARRIIMLEDGKIAKPELVKQEVI
ncbi:ABC transporter ATP-binding protein [Fulvivirga sp. 29W222]|uniref:ABC transporter ATP-binding protein n=1 Tax=Fulvivirga marina TaxID=2494733 RepID=A0A937KE15_9BACT|nr:ABC transporter ATP-binding protein [Fulvivirga marina]MBL6449237.1 ABC transporter ATP-binding protein [Fulvivirga marina]